MSGQTIQQAYDAAVRCHQAGQWDRAFELYQQILAAQPDHADALHRFALLAHQAGRSQMAWKIMERALAGKPKDARCYCDAAMILKAIGQLDEAIGFCKRAIELEPGSPDAHNALGLALKDRGRPEDAIASYQRALALRPDFPEALNNLGIVLRDGGQIDAAVACYRRALELMPQNTAALNNLGTALRDKGELDEAIACYRKSLAIRSDPAVASMLIYLLYFHPEYDAKRISQELDKWDQTYAQPLSIGTAPHANDRSPQRRLRVGYVSPHFHFQAEVFFVLPLLRSHDHQNFEIHCYASVLRPDELTHRLKACADRWHDVIALSDEQLAAKIRSDGIDILVDLNMHMGRNRLLLFARKPAPVQVTWLAYPGSTGLRAMDYRLTDAEMDPLGSNDADYSEHSVRLPDSWCCFDPITQTPDPGELPALRNGHITFGSLSSFCKINKVTLQRWAGVLEAAPNSRLLLLAPLGDHRQRVLDELNGYGVDPSRVEFVAGRPRSAYLELYQRLDIALDPFPYNGITTTCDALWMGVPVVSWPGTTAASRAGLSLLTTTGLPELVGHSREQFVRIAAELAGDLDRLAKLRSSLRQRFADSPLMDAGRFARNVEAAYRQMWRRWCAS